MTDIRAIRVVVVDDQLSIRTAIGDLLAEVDGIDVVGEATNGLEALAVVRDTEPDVVLMDLRMPVMNGVEATRRLSEQNPEVAVIVHTANDEESLVLDALQAGARGFTVKGSESSDLGRALTNVASGQMHVADKVTRPVIERLVQALNGERRTRMAAEEAARRLEVVNKRQRQFAMMSSHELRTPLTLLLTSIKALADTPSDEEDSRRQLERIALEGGRRLHRLVENLEIAANVESLMLKLEPVDVSAMCAELVAALPFASSPVELQIPLPLFAVGDRRFLAQAIHNLVQNALNASGKEDNVVVIARSDAGQVVIEVCDRGPGFDVTPDFGRDPVARLVPFSLRPSASGGLGLGLWVAGELIAAMGGRIVARNNADRGATVSLYLKDAAADGNVASPAA